MLDFMLKVLASNLFWVGYVVLTFIMTVIILRQYDDGDAMNDLLGDWDSARDIGWSIFVALVTLLFWPIILFVLAFIQVAIVLGKVLGIALKLAFKGADKITPNIDIKVKRR